MKKVVSAIILSLTLLGIPLSAHAVEAMGGCPVMPGHTAKQKFFVDYQSRRVYVCCRSCVKAFKKHPERYLKNLPKNDFSDLSEGRTASL